MTDTNEIRSYAEVKLTTAHMGELLALECVANALSEFTRATTQQPEQPFGRVEHLIEVFKGLGLLITWHGEKAAAVALKDAVQSGSFGPSTGELERSEILERIAKQARALCGGDRYIFREGGGAAAVARFEMSEAVRELEELEAAKDLDEEDDRLDNDESFEDETADLPIPYAVTEPEPSYGIFFSRGLRATNSGVEGTFTSRTDAEKAAIWGRQTYDLPYYVDTI